MTDDHYSLNHRGVATPIRPRKGREAIKGAWDRLYKYSATVLRKIREAESCLYGKHYATGCYLYMITYTFPDYFDNQERSRLNDKFRDRARKHFPMGGLWVTEAHQEKSKGKFHFHYMVLTEEPNRGNIVKWLQRQQLHDGVAVNSYDVKAWSYETRDYMSGYAGKESQKLVISSRRIWACWGLDRNPIEVDRFQLSIFDVKPFGEHGQLIANNKGVNNFIQIQKLHL